VSNSVPAPEEYSAFSRGSRHATLHHLSITPSRENEMPAAKETEFVLIYSVFPNRAVAEKIGRALLEARLAACVNIFPPMTSLYEWEGKLETSRETAAIIKTRRALADQLVETARPLHPYTVPCFLVLPVEGGNPAFLDWVRAQTVGSGTV
jgi:periplasmic divalent cation tolerance protein